MKITRDFSQHTILLILLTFRRFFLLFDGQALSKERQGNIEMMYFMSQLRNLKLKL